MKPVWVGNDVVDLKNPRTEGRSTDDRFVARVLDDGEREAVRSCGNPDLELWSRWAAKEAGFKAISKMVGGLPGFVHRSFRARWASSREAPAGPDEVLIRQGTVHYEEQEARVCVTLRPGGVHALALAGPALDGPARVHARVAVLDQPGSRWSGTLEELLPRFTRREVEAVRTRESAAVRLGARADLAELLGVGEQRVEIVSAPGPATLRPPLVLLDGRETEADLSLSHDGHWIAWAVCVAAASGAAS
ncbi:MAG TPA: 4'-phosphopantetheinyl transferase superfamily protein [Longimicrobiales bacterium]|nr:4'-phosphopantetheinyl transferase superfamily protein [Longimicrobiales bacterium]